jgi:hypothetical protein
VLDVISSLVLVAAFLLVAGVGGLTAYWLYQGRD